MEEIRKNFKIIERQTSEESQAVLTKCHIILRTEPFTATELKELTNLLLKNVIALERKESVSLQTLELIPTIINASKEKKFAKSTLKAIVDLEWFSFSCLPLLAICLDIINSDHFSNVKDQTKISTGIVIYFFSH